MIYKYLIAGSECIVKAANFFPFERNRYFYGKLLTANDFEAEQKYLNGKRSMLNRLLHGVGVVCGMNVVKVDDNSIIVESGLALDYAGREIVVDQSVVRKLSALDGFGSYQNEETKEAGYVYLCVDYFEAEAEPVHSIVQTSVKDMDGMEHGKYEEGYRLFLTSREPAGGLSPDSLYKERRIVYWGHGIKITQSMPKYIHTTDEFAIEIEIEKYGQSLPVKLNYAAGLRYISHEGSDCLKVEFDESKLAAADAYKLSYVLSAANVYDAEGEICIRADAFDLYVGEMKVETDVDFKSTINIISGGEKQKMIRDYYGKSLDKYYDSTANQYIYLAKIYLIVTGSVYIIQKIEKMPFGQYVYNGMLGNAMCGLYIEEETGKKSKAGRIEAAAGDMRPLKDMEAPLSVKTGTVTFTVPVRSKPGLKLYSDDIVHGLGLGDVYIDLGMEETGEKPVTYFGSQNVFKDGETFTAGAKLDKDKGTFVAGLLLNSETSVNQVKVHWIAYKKTDEASDGVVKKEIVIKPDMKYVSVRETIYFEAVVRGQGLSGKEVKWAVKDPRGGSIDTNGMYTASGYPGIYEVTAESVHEPGLKGSAFVVVSDFDNKL